MQSGNRSALGIRRFRDHVVRVMISRTPPDEDRPAFDVLGIAIFGALAGLSMGIWSGGWQLVYVALKAPMLLGGSLLIGFPAMVVFGRLLGCPLTVRAAWGLAMATIARTAAVLAALAPVTMCFTVSLPSTEPTTYKTIVFVHVVAFAIAGLVGVTALRGRLARHIDDAGARWRVVLLWIAIYSFVGAQLTWVLRPFLATPGLPLEFLRSFGPLGLESNFYISVYQIVGG
jgi:hypothetical protein